MKEHDRKRLYTPEFLRVFASKKSISVALPQGRTMWHGVWEPLPLQSSSASPNSYFKLVCRLTASLVLLNVTMLIHFLLLRPSWRCYLGAAFNILEMIIA